MAIDAVYEPTFRDFLALNRWIVRRRWQGVRHLSVLMIALYLASPFLFHDLVAEGIVLPYVQSLAVLAFPAVFLVLLPASLYVTARRRWDAAPELREPRRFHFSEKNIAVEGGAFSGRIAWSQITRAEADGALFILKTKQDLYCLISESGFTDEADRDAFVSLVRKKVSPTFGRRSVLGRVKFLEPSRSLDRGS